MDLRFTKMHGLGNDFVVIDAVTQEVTLSPAQVRFLADRRRGIGCDQVLVAEPARLADTDFRYRIYNADGGEVEMCGNGARCFARFVREAGLTDRDRLTVETRAGLISLTLRPDGEVSVDMGVPRLAPAEVPFVAEAQAPRYALEAAGEHVEIGAVSMGNPHAVLQVADVDTAPVAHLGAAIESHARFPERANVGFMHALGRGHIRLRVYERGVGETPACGTGACAAVVVGRVQGLLDETVAVDLAGGRLTVSWRGPGQSVQLTGPATRVFEGTIRL
jgi:diaminopimelate epimerase